MARQVADGFDNAGSLADITSDDQGVSASGLRRARYLDLADGTVKADGAPYEVLEYTDQTPADYVALLAAWGLTEDIDNVSNEITYATPGVDRETNANYNAIVVHRKGEDAHFADGVYTRAIFTVKIVEAL